MELREERGIFTTILLITSIQLLSSDYWQRSIRQDDSLNSKTIVNSEIKIRLQEMCLL